jgi:hypothetical protein
MAIPDADKALLAAPPDCSAPEVQIAALEELKPTDLDKVVTASGYVSASGLIVGAVNNDFDDRSRIIDGQYEAEIDRKISAIRAECGISSTP